MENDDITGSQIASWYHAQILRIPHGRQTPTKRYLTDEQVIELFDGEVVIQEKVDGKMTWSITPSIDSPRIITIIEDLTGKHTVHDHVMKYTTLPYDKHIPLDNISTEYTVTRSGTTRRFKIFPDRDSNVLDYAKVKLSPPTIGAIRALLEMFSKSQSHFGSDTIEGLVVKNYPKGKFGKWVNDGFEDGLKTACEIKYDVDSIWDEHDAEDAIESSADETGLK